MKATMIAALVAPAVATEMCVEGVARAIRPKSGS
jgi:hypothetical protein